MSTNVAKWRVAHPDIEINDNALETMAFPSLFANDFIAYLSSKGESDEVITFVRDLSREIVWVYGMLAKAQHDAIPRKLLENMLENSRGPGYEFTHKFLNDYAKANNIGLTSGGDDTPAWQKIDWQNIQPPGTVSA